MTLDKIKIDHDLVTWIEEINREAEQARRKRIRMNKPVKRGTSRQAKKARKLWHKTYLWSIRFSWTTLYRKHLMEAVIRNAVEGRSSATSSME